jgi:hypothetical protein
MSYFTNFIQYSTRLKGGSQIVIVCGRHDLIYTKLQRFLQKTTRSNELIQQSCSIQNQHTEISNNYLCLQ